MHADIDADIAAVRENIAKCRKLAEDRKVQGELMIAEQVLEFVADLEVRVAQLEAMAKSAVNDQ